MRRYGIFFTDLIGEDDAYSVHSAVIELAAKFRSLGRALGLRASELDTISKNCPLDAKEALGQVVDMWISQCYNVKQFGRPSWRMLVMAVDSPAGGNNHLLARKIAADHPGIHCTS